MASLQWTTSTDGGRLPLFGLDLGQVKDFGVYVIWHGGPSWPFVRVGQGNIADRLAKHRKDPEIRAFFRQGLFVTWARTGILEAGGIEQYVAQELRPLVGERFPDLAPIPVNLPFGPQNALRRMA